MAARACACDPPPPPPSLPSPVAPPQLSDLPRPHVCVVRVWQPDPVGRMALFGYEMVI